MSRLLVLFGTTDGHTRKIAWAIADAVESAGCRVDILDANLSGRTMGAEPYDGVIVAASLHARGYQRAVERWVRRNARTLGGRPSAFVSVGLGILERNPGTRHELDTIVQTFQWKTGWRPDAVRMVAGALPYTRYGWLKKRMMRRIAAKAGGDTDITRDYDYTDWAALRTFAQDFVWSHGFARVMPPVVAPSPALPVAASPPALPVVAPPLPSRALVGVGH